MAESGQVAQSQYLSMQGQEQEEDVIDFKELISLLLNHRWVILGTMLSFILLAAIYCKLETPIYQANLLIDSNVSSGGNALGGLLGSTVNVFDFGRTDSATEEQIIMSRSVLGPVVSDLHLDILISPKYFPILGHSIARNYNQANYANVPNTPRLGLAQYDWGGNNLKLDSFEVSDDLKGQRFILKYLGDNNFELKNTAGKILLTGTLGQSYKITPNFYSSINLKVSSLKANPEAEFYIEQQRLEDAIDALNSRLQIVDSGKQTNLITLQLKGTDPALVTETLNSIGRSAVMFDVNSQANEASKTLNFLQSRLPAVKQALDLAEKKLNQYLATSGDIQLSDEGKMFLEKMGQLETQASTLQVQKAQLQQQYTDQSFQVQQVQTALDQLAQERQSLEAEIKQLPESDQIQMGLKRDALVQNKIYVNLLDKIQQFEILQAGTVGKVAVVDEAAVPYKSINKPAPLVIALAGFLAFFLSAGFFFVRQFLFRGVEDPDLVESKLGLNVFGTIQESKLQAQQLKNLELRRIKYLQFLSEMDPHDLVVESLRSLRTNLLFELPRAKNNIIAISGPTPGVGKSFISVNFAQILADAGYKVLLVDADIRKGTAHVYFDVPRSPGFCDLIDQKISQEVAVHHSRMPNLDFISTGTMPAKHAEFLMKPRVKEILDQLATQYDYVIFDTAPILAVTDALQLFKHAGTHLLVLSYGKHDLKEIEHTLSKFEKGGVEVKGAIFNRIKAAHSYYGKKYKYNYRYDYESKNKH